MKKSEKKEKKTYAKKTNGIGKRNKSNSAKNSEEDFIASNHESMDISDQEDKNIKILDLSISKIFNVSGGKGHSTFYSATKIDVGTWYFEVEIKENFRNISEYITQNKKTEDNKKHEEFMKKYYSPCLTENQKMYNPTVRIGICSEDGDLELPLGCNEFSFSYRGSDGHLISNGNYCIGNSSFKNGDIVGVLIHIKDPMPEFIKLKERPEKNSKGTDKNSHSFVKFYHNGELQNKYFHGLWESKYHVGVTLYNFANATVKFSRKDLKYYQKVVEENQVFDGVRVISDF